MNPLLLAALLEQIAIPELQKWLRERHSTGQPLTDADILQKLITDTDLGIRIGSDWLASHP